MYIYMYIYKPWKYISSVIFNLLKINKAQFGEKFVSHLIAKRPELTEHNLDSLIFEIFQP